MASGIAHVYLVFAIALVFCVWTSTRTLDDLLGAKVYLHVIVAIGHGDTGNGRVPVDTSPTYINMVWVVCHDKW